MSNGGDSISSGNYGQAQQTYHRNQSFSKQSATVMSPNLPQPMPADNVRNSQASRVSFIGQGRKPEPFSTNSSFMKVSSSFFPSVRFNNPSSSGFLPRNLRKDEMMWLMRETWKYDIPLNIFVMSRGYKYLLCECRK